MTRVLSEWDAKLRLGPDLPRPREERFDDAAEAMLFANRLGGPVVAKASGVAHKSDRGLVRLGLQGIDIISCWNELAGAGDGTVLVAEQVRPELELIVGGLRDPQFGPVVSVGVGGVLAEVLADVAFLLAPPEAGELELALAGLRGRALLDGYRGRPPVDRGALGRILSAVGSLLVTDPSVVEVDCNPVAVVDGRPLVLDALVVLEGSGVDT